VILPLPHGARPSYYQTLAAPVQVTRAFLNGETFCLYIEFLSEIQPCIVNVPWLMVGLQDGNFGQDLKRGD